MSFDLDGYVDVASRMAEFFAKHPDGSLRQHSPPELVTADGKTFVIYTAAAYRTPDDQSPGIGTAWEPVPGKTPYTKDSELMNAETSAWGRAILAVGAATTSSGVASKEEVRNRQTKAQGNASSRVARGQSSGATSGATGPTEAQAKFIRKLSGGDDLLVRSVAQEVHGSEVDVESMPRAEISTLIDELKEAVKAQDRSTRAVQKDKEAAVEAGMATGEPF